MADDDKEFLDVLEEVVERTIEKALATKDDKPVKEQPSTFFLNPYDFTSQTGMWRERRTAISWSTLRIIADKNPIISAIVNTRVNQVASFSYPVRIAALTNNNPLGFKVVHKDQDKKLTSGEKRFVQEVEDFIWHCGPADAGYLYSRDNFDGWLRKITRDSLTFDAGVAELIPTRKGSISEFYAVDAETIRLAVAAKEDQPLAEERAFVQILNGEIVAEYAANEIMYGIRNPTTSIRNNGYGYSELEQLVSVVTNIFNAMAHNAMFFKNGAAAKGIINIKGGAGAGTPNPQLEAFKRAWRAMMTGPANAWSTPILQTEGVEFINLGQNNREMEFQNYLDFLVKITCAVYSIDPGEINFFMQASGQSSPMFEGDPESKLKHSKDKGLVPLLSAVSRWVNQFILAPVAPEFFFTFDGIDTKDEKEVVEIRTKEVESYKMVDEVRQEAGLKPIGEDKGGNLILNLQYIQYLNQQAMMAAQMAAGGSEGGEEGEGTAGQTQQDRPKPAKGGKDKGEEAGPNYLTPPPGFGGDTEKSLSAQPGGKFLTIYMEE